MIDVSECSLDDVMVRPRTDRRRDFLLGDLGQAVPQAELTKNDRERALFEARAAAVRGRF